MNAHRPIHTTRRWFRFAFSLRTLFLAVTVSCCFLGYQLHWIHQRHEVLRSRQVREYFARTASGRGGEGRGRCDGSANWSASV